MSAFYSPPKDEIKMIKLIRHAVMDLGVTFLDTSDIYGPYTNEELIGKVALNLLRSSFESVQMRSSVLIT
jgi:aryl-alcohol dehydrogenase-like predicted oxidoreductase